jgi:hypothetical protein
MAYVYRHIRLDKNEPFYIGIGSDNSYKRAFEKTKDKRSIFWNNIVNKTNYEVEILMDNLTWEQACEKEKEFISMYGRNDLGKGTLVNMTDGGDGVINLNKDIRASISQHLKGKKQSEATKNKRKETLKKVWENQDLRDLKRMQTSNLSKEVRKRMADKLRGRKKPKRTEEEKIKIVNGLKEYYKSNTIHNKIIFSKEKEDLIIKYYNEKMPISKIAKHFFVSRNVIYRILNLKKWN